MLCLSACFLLKGKIGTMCSKGLKGLQKNFYGGGGNPRGNSWFDDVVALRLKEDYVVTFCCMGMNIDEILEKMPHSCAELLKTAKANPGMIIYPAPPGASRELTEKFLFRIRADQVTWGMNGKVLFRGVLAWEKIEGARKSNLTETDE